LTLISAIARFSRRDVAFSLFEQAENTVFLGGSPESPGAASPIRPIYLLPGDELALPAVAQASLARILGNPFAAGPLWSFFPVLWKRGAVFFFSSPRRLFFATRRNALDPNPPPKLLFPRVKPFSSRMRDFSRGGTSSYLLSTLRRLVFSPSWWASSFFFFF